MADTAEVPALGGRGWLRPALLGAALGIVVVGAPSRFHVDRMTFGDGRLYRYVAEHLSAGRAQVERDLAGHGTVLRYGRIGLPALLWVASAGRSRAMPYAQPALMILSAAAIAAAAAELLPEASELVASLAPFLAFGLLLGLTGGFTEPIAVAFALWAVVLARRGRWWPSAILLDGALLTREYAAGVLLGLIAWALFRRERRGAAILASALVPVAAWHLVIAWRFGVLPLRDPYVAQADNIGLPFSALGRALAQSSASADVIIVLHVVVLAFAIVMARRSDLATIAAISGLVLLVTGAFPWRYLGDALRWQTFTEVAFVLAVATELLRRRRRITRVPGPA